MPAVNTHWSPHSSLVYKATKIICQLVVYTLAFRQQQQQGSHSWEVTTKRNGNGISCSSVRWHEEEGQEFMKQPVTLTWTRLSDQHSSKPASCMALTRSMCKRQTLVNNTSRCVIQYYPVTSLHTVFCLA